MHCMVLLASDVKNIPHDQNLGKLYQMQSGNTMADQEHMTENVGFTTISY